MFRPRGFGKNTGKLRIANGWELKKVHDAETLIIEPRALTFSLG